MTLRLAIFGSAHLAQTGLLVLASILAQAGWSASDGTAVAAEAQPAAVSHLSSEPQRLELTGARARSTVVITGHSGSANDPAAPSRVASTATNWGLVDLTHQATYTIADPRVAKLVSPGQVMALADGQTELVVEAASHTLRIPLVVRDAALVRPMNFENDIVPLLSRFGCNTSGCHGKAEGQNGFKLSVFGFDPAADFDALVKEGRGRRLSPAAPARSLLLTKATGTLPHGGGVRLAADSPEYDTLLQWITAGMPFGQADDPRVASIEVWPASRQLPPGGQQQLRVVATWSDGRQADVTPLARFQSNHDALAAVGEGGLVRLGDSPGQVAIMASYMGAVGLFQAMIPRPGPAVEAAQFAELNFIDPLVNRQLQKLNIAPSGGSSDAVFLRRVSLDLIGTLPAAAEVREFLADTRPDRRQLLVDRLLQRPEYADYWALWWSDLLRVDRQALGHKGAYALYGWIRQQLAENRPIDEWTRDLIAAEGPLVEVPQGYYFLTGKRPGDLAASLSQTFLGVRIACAECHHHPYDRWGQHDYYGMQSFFQPLSRKKSPWGEVLSTSGAAEAKHPRTGETVPAHALGTTTSETVPSETPPSETRPPETSQPGDRRLVLSQWMTAADNPWFARNVANRYWAHLLGRGLVEPVDDVRDTNPPTNPELLSALADHLVQQQFDLKALLRTITASAAYQRAAEPNDTNQLDEQNYSRALYKRLPAEVLYDAVCQATGVSERYEGVPGQVRAIQLWDSQVNHYFLKLFGRPERQTACQCERNVEASVAQVLHLMNSPQIQDKLSHAGGRVAQLVRQFPDNNRTDNAALTEELYLTFACRLPTQSEQAQAERYLQQATAGRRAAAEDLAWTLLNSLEFVFNR